MDDSPGVPVRDADWRASLERANYEEAAGRLRALELVGSGEPEALKTVLTAVDVVSALRGRDYEGALVAARKLEGLPDLGTGVTAGGLAAVENLRQADNRRRDPAAGRAYLEAALANPLTRAEAENNLGVLEATAGNSDAARGHFERALQADPRHYRAITNLGNLQLEAGDTAGAIERYRESIRLNGDYSTAHNNLAAALRRTGKRAESVASLKRAQKLALKESRPGAATTPSSGGSIPGRARSGAPKSIFANQYVRWFLIGALLVVLYRLLVR
jgi:tetratricopeptide (TPR) repeat protein